MVVAWTVVVAMVELAMVDGRGGRLVTPGLRRVVTGSVGPVLPPLVDSTASSPQLPQRPGQISRRLSRMLHWLGSRVWQWVGSRTPAQPKVGGTVGELVVGWPVGDGDGSAVVGAGVGAAVVGDTDSKTVGETDGSGVGTSVGTCDGARVVGAPVSVGATVVGAGVGNSDGAGVGDRDGAGVGASVVGVSVGG
jgi:hypothetical protein